jgi:hypothetical protein
MPFRPPGKLWLAATVKLGPNTVPAGALLLAKVVLTDSGEIASAVAVTGWAGTGGQTNVETWTAAEAKIGKRMRRLLDGDEAR